MGATIEERQDRVENVVEAVQSQVEELQMRSPMVATDEREISLWRHGGDADDHHGPMATVSHAVEQGIATFDRRFSEQLQDLASTPANVKVKVEGQAQRALTLAERLETAHEPAVDALREELTQARVQDWSRVESEAACNDGETVQAGADTNVWAHLENLKAHVSMSFGNIMEQRQQIDDTRAFVGTLSEQMAALDASVQYARQQGDQASSECKALAQRLRNLQEHDFVAVCQDVGQTKSLVNELAGLVGCVVERHPGAEPIAYMQSPPIPWTCQ